MLTLFPMEARKLFAKAENEKRRIHRLRIDLRLRSAAETRRFIREQGVVLWQDRAELPCVLDAVLGRIANSQERRAGKPLENCRSWRKQLLGEPEFMECSLFRKRSTVVHQDLWTYVAACSRSSKRRCEEDGSLSRDARRLLAYIVADGPTRADVLRRVLKWTSSSDRAVFNRAVKELCDHLLLVTRPDPDAGEGATVSVVDLLENSLPKNLRTKSESLNEKEASAKLLAATINSCVLAPEKSAFRWFPWLTLLTKDWVESLVRNRDCIRIVMPDGPWLVSRKVVGKATD